MRYSSFDDWTVIGDLVDEALEDLIGAPSPAEETGEKEIVEESNSTIAHDTAWNKKELLERLDHLENGLLELRDILRGEEVSL